MKSEEEVDSELIQIFRDRCYESYMKKVIGDLRKEEVLYKEYSVSGWMVFHCKTIYEIIEKTINYQKQKNEKKIKFLYCYYQGRLPTDGIVDIDVDIYVFRNICDKI